MKDLVARRRLAYEVGEEDRPRAPARRGAPAGQRVSPTVSASAIAEARNAVDAAHTGGDYRYQSVGDLIRAALRAYGEGMRLTQQTKGGRKTRHTVALAPELLERYLSLPSRSRGLIVERALLSFLAQGFDRRA